MWSPDPGLPAIGHGFVPQFAPHGVVGQPFDLVGEAIGIEPFDGLDNARVQRPSPLLEQAAIGHLMGEGMLKGVLPLGEQARLIEELSSLELSQTAVQRFLREVGDGL